MSDTGWGDVDVAQAEPARVDATPDGDEPVGEAPELTMPRVVSLVDRQAQALAEIRSHLRTVDGKSFVTEAFENAVISGQKRVAAVIAAILERNGLC